MPNPMTLTDLYELSPMQQGMLFHSLYTPNSGLYVEQRCCYIQGILVAKFKQSWQKLCDRHTILRSACLWKEVDKPLQVVYQSVELPWIEQDWRSLSEAAQLQELAAWLERDRQQGFALEQAPLMRCALLQVTDNGYNFVWTHHHLLLDGWCNAILLQEVFAIYEAALTGKLAALPQPRPYRDYILWLQQQDMAKAEQFWRRALHGFTTPSLIVNAVGTAQTSSFSVHPAQQLVVTPATTAELQAFAQKHHLTLNTLIQGAWAILLSRYSHATDVLFGMTVSGRPPELDGIETMIGLFINTLPVRVQLDSEMSLIQWLQQLQSQQSEQIHFSYSTLTDIQTWSELPQGTPLFDSLLIFENYPTSIADALKKHQQTHAPLQISPLPVVSQVAQTNYPLTVTVFPGNIHFDRALTLQVSYDSECFSDQFMQRLLEHLETLLTALLESPEQSSAHLPMLTATEQQQLQQWNQTGIEYDLLNPEHTVHHLIAAQSQRAPDAVALVSQEQQLTYGELNARANQLAHWLHQQQVDSLDAPIGICLDRSPEQIISLLAILKSGAAYLPLDPTYPSERLAWMLQDAQVQLILTHSKLLSHLPTQIQRVFLFDVDGQKLTNYRSDNPPDHITSGQPASRQSASRQPASEQLAYIIYTSGSTGRPKGVMIPHRALLNYALAARDKFELTPADRMLQFASIGFDTAAEEIFPTLLAGATLVLRSEEMLQPSVLLQTCREQQLTILDLPTAYWQQLTQSVTLSLLMSLPSLRLTIIGGEAASLDSIHAWQQTGIRLLNTYGPTETTIVATWWELPQQPQARPSLVSIGKPVPNVQVYVLDSYLNMAPIGVAGELYIGGAGIAKGYLNQPQLTVEKFSAHLLNKPAYSSHLYKTGDRVRYLPDGNLEFLGRFDRQIKLRGVRIEPGEIEALLEQHTAIKTAVVTLQSGCAEPQLVAYYLPILAASDLPSSSELRQFLSRALPFQMLPTAFVALETLPLTPSGKVDRNQLAERPLPAKLAPTRPTTPTEELLVGIWEMILDRSGIGLEDSFFELGGHSLRATQVISQIRQIFQIEIPLRAVFDHPTIAALAPVIEQFQQAETAPILPAQYLDSWPLSYAQQRQWFLAQLEPDSPFYNISAAVQIIGLLNPAVLQQSFQQVLSRHQVLCSAFQTLAGQPVQQISLLPLEIPLIDLSHLSNDVQTQQVQQWRDRESKQPFALSQPPLLRLKLLRLDDSTHILLLTLHHIVADGWSIGILLQELAVLYPALQRGAAPSLPLLPIQYADFAVWQRQQNFGESLAYWKAQLQDAPVLELPTDYPRPATRSLRGANYRFQLSPFLTQALQQLSRQTGCTLFMTLLTVFNILLHRYTDSDDIVVGTVIANRNRAELESLIGFFVNTLALRSNLSGNPTVEALLHQMRETALAAYAHQDLPFEQLVDALQPERSLSYTPLFQVMFVLQNEPMPAVELAGLTWTPFTNDSGTAKFDLTLSMQEEAGILHGAVEYSLDLFAAETIEQMAIHFQKLLSGIVSNPEQRLSDLSLFCPDEQQKLLNITSYNQLKDTVNIQGLSVHRLFEKQVQLTPDAVAVVCQTAQLSYAALNVAANQLAHYLQSFTITSGEPIGLYLERSPDLIISILAILKLGAVYVPLDLDYPAERLAFMLSDAQIKWVLTTSNVPGLSLEPNLQQIHLDLERSAIVAGRSDNLTTPVTPEHLAYIMYTSGSTGKPKGVCIAHRGILRLVQQPNYVELENEIILQAAPTTFDASTFEIWGALLNGGQLVLLPTQQPDLAQLEQAIAQHHISTLWLTAGLFHLMVEERIASLKPLRQLLAGGDSLSSRHVQQLSQTYPHIRLINGYGPTENTTFTCCYTVTHADTHSGTNSDFSIVSLPIGVPVSGTEAYILDRYLQLLPIGVPGELYTTGLGLAQSYLNQPALTAEKFIPNPFAAASRLYKTGDRVRYRQDGTIEYLGRFDQQVKIRGFRVELGEIAAALEQHLAVQAAIVVPDAELGPKRLVAYVVPNELHGTTDAVSLRDFLKAKLPDYMIPAAFICLDTLPLTANGKVDRRALPAPVAPVPSATAPRTAIETTLARIWASALGRQVGIDDNFFEQGGDSILAIQIVSRAHQAGLKITPKQIFQHQTIAELAAAVDQVTARIPILARQEIVTGIIPLTPIQRWFFEQKLPHQHHYNQAVSLQIKSPLNRDWLKQAIAALLQHHDALRSRFILTETGWQQQIVPPDDLPLIEIDYFNLATESAEEIELQIAQTAQQLQAGLDLASQLVQVAWFKLDQLHTDRLLFIVHHLVIDAVSWRILLDDFQAVYQQLAIGQPIQLPAKTTSVQQWAERLQLYANSEAVQQKLANWLSNLSASEWVALPADFPTGANTAATSEQIRLMLTVEQTQTLLTEVPRAFDARIQEVLLTALVQTLTEWMGHRSLRVDVESHGREQPWEEIDLSRSVGWFTTIMPVLLVASEAQIEPNLRQIKQRIRAAVQNSLEYGILRYLKTDFSLPNIPASEVSFNYLGQVGTTFDAAETSMLELLQQPIGNTQSLLQPKLYRLEINGAITAGQLHLDWSYSRDQYHHSTMLHLTERFQAILLHLIESCHSQIEDAPSDFALVELDSAQLETVLAQVTFESGLGDDLGNDLGNDLGETP